MPVRWCQYRPQFDLVVSLRQCEKHFASAIADATMPSVVLALVVFQAVEAAAAAAVSLLYTTMSSRLPQSNIFVIGRTRALRVVVNLGSWFEFVLHCTVLQCVHVFLYMSMHVGLIYTVFRKKHPLTFSIIIPAFLGRFLYFLY